MKVVCRNPECAKIFEVRPSRLAREQGKFCSRACRFHRTPEQRFWGYVQQGNDNECWEWTRSKTSDGYGNFHVSGRNMLAHRFSWELHFGPIPLGEGHHGICVLHSCDNPGCVAPHHLFLGSPQTNATDMVQKGRSARGSANGMAKLNEAKVREVRWLYSMGGWTQQSLGEEYGVCRRTIGHAITRRNWKEVE